MLCVAGVAIWLAPGAFAEKYDDLAAKRISLSFHCA